MKSYSQIEARCGSDRAHRIVSAIENYGNTNLQWQRVANKQGGLASGYPGGRQAHAEHLKLEGLDITEGYYIVDMDKILWSPSEGNRR